eukprot:COSAG06_NODE_173_length_21283_cov_14.116220_5_plen_187_part_00
MQNTAGCINLKQTYILQVQVMSPDASLARAQGRPRPAQPAWATRRATLRRSPGPRPPATLPLPGIRTAGHWLEQPAMCTVRSSCPQILVRGQFLDLAVEASSAEVQRLECVGCWSQRPTAAKLEVTQPHLRDARVANTRRHLEAALGGRHLEAALRGWERPTCPRDASPGLQEPRVIHKYATELCS